VARPDRTAGQQTSLHKLTEDVTLSIRLRYYATGSRRQCCSMRLEGPAWKTRLINENLTIQDALR